MKIQYKLCTWKVEKKSISDVHIKTHILFIKYYRNKVSLDPKLFKYMGHKFRKKYQI